VFVALGLVLAIHHAPRVLAVGDPLPALQLTDLDGNTVALGSVASRTAVYNVFTSWCPACNEELPEMKHTAAVLSQRGVPVIGIDQGETAWEIERFAASNGLHYQLLMDSRRITTGRLGARIIPETLVVRDGIVRRIIVGPATSAQILAAVGGG